MKLNNEGLHPQDINVISNNLLDMLVDIARQIIETRPENENFQVNPDDPNEHVSNWHQFGIITHTKVVLDAYITTISEYFIDWQVEDKIRIWQISSYREPFHRFQTKRKILIPFCLFNFQT